MLSNLLQYFPRMMLEEVNSLLHEIVLLNLQPYFFFHKCPGALDALQATSGEKCPLIPYNYPKKTHLQKV